MKLNPDCVRKILLVVESLPDLQHHWDFNQNTIPELIGDYSFDEIMYHLRQCDLNGFFHNASHNINYSSYCVYDLSPKGHEFLANIRNDTFYNKVKKIGKELGVQSLRDINQIALSAASVLIQSYFTTP